MAGISPAGATRPATWTSGAWSVERRDDELADLRFRGRLVLRSVRAVVRDHDWSTPALVVEEVRDTGDELTIAVRSEGFGSAIAGSVSVRADGDRLSVSWRGSSAVDYLTNRTGLVVLHPPHLAGAALDVLHPDGSRERTAFPRDISPHQPVLDIARLGWQDGGVDVEVAFEGDVFEMEDQRNWTDASYKTYSRPLGLPFPYAIAAGEQLRQTVEVRASGVPVPGREDGAAHISLTPSGPFPAVLTSASSAPDPAPAVPPIGDALLVELDLATPSWRAALDRAAASGLPLDVRLVLPQDEAEDLTPASLAALDDAVTALAPHTVVRIAAFSRLVHTSRAAHVEALRDALDRAGSSAQVLGGARSHFTELNREQAHIPAGVDGVVFSVTPLFHALGTEQLVESVPMQRLVAEQGVAIAAGRPVHIGPVTLRPRFNDVATAPQPAPARTDLAEGYGAQFTGADDARQSAPELAAWTIASAAALAVPGVASLVHFEEWGPRGLRDARGAARPVAAAVEALAALSGAELLTGPSPDGLVWAIGGRRAGEEVVLAANLSAQAREIEIEIGIGERTIRATLPAGTWARLAPEGGHARRPGPTTRTSPPWRPGTAQPS
ncbi:hypothetical protein N8K70_06265 [Microbacterium betulae]|uniref:Uncharacterized protein n=1 Tax=Microbacterium betulae TaxID=2981139 RepID=A0AA97FK56_9MICO|nr:hypothetical protein [Microbacterium sp. AB]WOF24273.1 hypothetical protein N8K70_06265 [Microbacterium sp. AB]